MESLSNYNWPDYFFVPNRRFLGEGNNLIRHLLAIILETRCAGEVVIPIESVDTRNPEDSVVTVSKVDGSYRICLSDAYPLDLSSIGKEESDSTGRLADK